MKTTDDRKRKALYYILTGILVLPTLPIWLVAIVTAWICDKVADVCDIIRYMLHV